MRKAKTQFILYFTIFQQNNKRCFDLRYKWSNLENRVSWNPRVSRTAPLGIRLFNLFQTEIKKTKRI